MNPATPPLAPTARPAKWCQLPPWNAKHTATMAETVAATLQVLTKLRGEVEFAPPGSLPNDGKTIADERPAG